MNKELSIGLIGFGCVGSGLYEVLNKSGLIQAKISKIVVKDRYKKRPIKQENFSYKVNDILEDESINVVVELIDDSEQAFEIVKCALASGKDVVSANKKMIAEHLDELLELANSNGVSLLYEGAVAGSIPILRNLEEYYNNDSLTSLQGIVNGTTNYILTQSNYGIAYADALAQAQELGFAESNPTLDVDGYDSKYKLSILFKHAFGLSVDPKQLFNLGIRHISPHAVAYAKEKGYRIKLFSRAEKLGNQVVGFVAPHFVKSNHFAYSVNDEFNAVILEGLFSDQQLFVGKGAGSHPTASAVLSDISALKFDYKYEYRKVDANHELTYSDDFFVKVYIESKYIEAINEIPFYHVDELFQSDQVNYQTGWVKFSELKEFDFNHREDLSLVILPEALKESISIEKVANRPLLETLYN
ncbi:MAG: homoserine dehydrogenase [Crocinitomicaceae bacterium]|nr:homoserine dehydrogenase [Crocinitomicaceae bacterium]